MEFGDRSRFSITIELDTKYGGLWLFGRIAYWISGAMIGSYDLGTSLRDVLFQMTPILGGNGRRSCPKLCHLDKDEIFSRILAAMEETSDAIYEYVPADFCPGVFDVRIPVDVFDSWKIFLVEDHSEAKIQYRKIDSSTVSQMLLRIGEFDEAFTKAYVYLEQLYEKEVVIANAGYGST